MPLDPAGDTKIYPDAQVNYKWALEPSGHIDAGERHNISVPGGGGGEGYADHAQALRQGYMNSPNDWKNIEMKIHFDGDTGDDEMTLYGRGGRHNDNCACCGFAYKMGFRSRGDVRMGKETWHVHYDYGNTNSGSSLLSYSGVCFCLFNVNNNQHVRCQGWVDRNNNNTWNKVYDWTDSGFGTGGSHCGTSDDQPGTWGGPYATFRCDDFDYDFKNMSVREIGLTVGNQSGTSMPGGGGGSSYPLTGNSPPGTGGTTAPGTTYPGMGSVGSGGGGAGDDLLTGTGGTYASGGCACTNGTCVGTCGGTGQGTVPVGGAEGQAPSSATEPVPLITVYKDLGLFWNIRVDLDDNCNISGNANVPDYEEIYLVQPVSQVYQQLFSNGHIKAGCKLRSENSVLWRERIRKVTVIMKKSTTSALSGMIKCEIRDRNGKLYHTFTTEIDAAAVDVNDTAYDFISNNNEYRMETGDMILLWYEGGNSTNHILVAHNNTDALDGFDTAYVRSVNGTNYQVVQTEDFSASISV
jgi:hypothetical protein